MILVLAVAVLVSLSAPFAASAQNFQPITDAARDTYWAASTFDIFPIVRPCQGGPQIPDTNERECNLKDAVAVTNRIIKAMLMLSVPAILIASVYTGYLFLTAGENTGKVKEARKIFTNVAIGVIIILLAWLVIRIITQNLGLNEAYNPLQ